MNLEEMGHEEFRQWAEVMNTFGEGNLRTTLHQFAAAFDTGEASSGTISIKKSDDGEQFIVSGTLDND